jgi:Methyltransferase domain
MLRERLKQVPLALRGVHFIRKIRKYPFSLPILRQFRSLQLRRTSAIHSDRNIGTPIVRYYWHLFLQQHQEDIKGKVLEVGMVDTAKKFASNELQEAVSLDIYPSSKAMLIGDLSTGSGISSDTFDCFLNQFTFHIIYDYKAALFHSVRLLKPGGVLLANFPARSGYPHKGIDLKEAGTTFVYQWFTPAGVEQTLQEIGLSKDDYLIRVYGNYFSFMAYLAGLPAEELNELELAEVNPDIPLLVCARIRKPANFDHSAKMIL